MNFSNISAWSIRNPVVPIVLFVALTIAGIMAFMNMDVQNDPDIDFLRYLRRDFSWGGTRL